MLTNPFPAQQQQMVAKAPSPPSGNNVGKPLQGSSSSSATILMTNIVIEISTRAKNYDPPKGESNEKENTSTSQLDGSLTLERPTFEIPFHPSKGASC